MGEEGANALLMGFIQAWRLQARPPLGRVGVNPPHPLSSLTAPTPERWSTSWMQPVVHIGDASQTNKRPDSCCVKRGGDELDP